MAKLMSVLAIILLYLSKSGALQIPTYHSSWIDSTFMQRTA